MSRPDWSGAGSDRVLNLRQAQLSGAYLVGARLVGAQMEGANLFGAQLEGANLFGAQVEGANFSFAQMEGADLNGAQMEGAVLVAARMEGANLLGAQMKGANLIGAQMENVDLRSAEMEAANLLGAQMKGADLSFSRFFGSADRMIGLITTNLNAVTNNGGALRFVVLTGAAWDEQTDFRNVFLDGTVTMTPAFRTRMGHPCQWITHTLDDTEFLSLWRWWAERITGFLSFLPDKIQNAPLPTEARLEELGLTDCQPNQPFGPMPDAN